MDTKKLLWSVVGVLSLMILLWVGSGFAIYNWLPCSAERGQFGDMFGAVNSLFSGLALAGVVIAIFLQTWELRQQREGQERSEQAILAVVRSLQWIARSSGKP